jgi:putative heme-binding domain-containing protein
MILWKSDGSAAEALVKLTDSSPRAEARLQSLCVLDGLDCLPPRRIRRALADQNDGVRRHAVRLAEKRLKDDAELGPALLRMTRDTDAQVRLQLAFTLGEWRDPRSGQGLAELLSTYPDDAYLRAAVLSSLRADNLPVVLRAVFQSSASKPLPQHVFHDLLGVAVALGDQKQLSKWLQDVTTPQEDRYAPWQLAALTGVLEAFERRGQNLEPNWDETMRLQIGRMFSQARATAANAKGQEQERRLSLALLGRDPMLRDEDMKLLGDLLAPQNSATLQAAAVAALGRIHDARVSEALTDGWPAHSPALKGQILDVLLSRDTWQLLLLDLIEKKTLPAAQIDAARRQRLLAHRQEKIRTRAAKLFDGAISPDRLKVLEDYKQCLTLTGNSRRGKAVFAKSCSVCHRLEGVGHAVGADLQALSNKSPLYLLTEILDPNRNLDTRYLTYMAVTRSGRTYTGILASESATSITLRNQEGKEDVLLRSELDELQSTGKSLMPEGLEKELSKQDVANLIAYLTAQGPPELRK